MNDKVVPAVSSNLTIFSERLSQIRTQDRYRLGQQLKRLKRLPKSSPQDWERLAHRIDQSWESVQYQKDHLPAYVLDETLPIFQKRADILQALTDHQIVIVCGETGSGKTTQLPLLCLEAGRGVQGLIGHTQPRRIAARTIAQRVAAEMGQSVGAAVGYQVRFNDKTSPRSYLKIMTDGILLAETHRDPWLSHYDTLIIDEAHERSLNIDFLLGFLKRLCRKRRDLKLIVTSATIDAQRFSAFFDQAPVIEVSGRLYPVEIRYRPPDEEKTAGKNPYEKNTTIADVDQLSVKIGQAVDEAAAHGEGDMLVFLPGEREIREAAEYLRKAHPPQTRILPLYARQSVDEQRLVFERSNSRKIVLATNVAETSLTVPGIRFVIDTGLARVKRYSHRQKVEQLRIERISKASANQRAGRCGRVSAGICFRLFEESDFELRSDYTDPEILRSSLAGVILRMKALNLGDVERFDFIDPPRPNMVAEGYRFLADIGALDEQRRLTPIGKEIAHFPLDPKIARILLEARKRHCLTEMAIICSALSVQDPRERPAEKREAADMAHRRFHDEQSECLDWVKLWHHVDEMIKHRKSNRKLIEQCRKAFLSYLRLREWRDVHRQLHSLMTEAGWRFNEQSGSVEEIVCSLLAGFLGHIGMKTEDGDYIGPHGLRFWIHPASSFKKKAPKWLVAAELVETSRLFARNISVIQPQWVENVAAHLLSRQYLDPHWSQSQGRVVAYERLSLYGLVIIPRRPVHFGPIDPALAREIFIRRALVEGEYESKAPFWRHNQALIDEIEQMEHRTRRQDILVDEETRYRFYDEKIPPDITQKATFEKWRKNIEQTNPEVLFFTRESLMRHDGMQPAFELYPSTWVQNGISYALSYWHEPGSFRDGVTLTLPFSFLNQIQPNEWLVPGLLKEKVQYLCKSLPQRYRAALIPLPAFVGAFVDAVFEGKILAEGALIKAIADFAKTHRNATIPLERFDREMIPDHLKMNYKLVDELGKQMAMSRDLAALKKEYGHQTQEEAVVNPYGEQKRHQWDFGDLAFSETITTAAGYTKQVYPAIVDEGDAVRIGLYDTLEAAEAAHRQGLARLLALTLKERSRYVMKALAKQPAVCSKFTPIASLAILKERFLFSVLNGCFLSGDLPRTLTGFKETIAAHKSELLPLADQTLVLLNKILDFYHQVLNRMKSLSGQAALKTDIENQLEGLVTVEFWLDIPSTQLWHYPRFLEAILVRIDKFREDPNRDHRLLGDFRAIERQYHRACQQHEGDRSPALESVRWALEELRVSLFAQSLKTAYPISARRIEKMLEKMLS